MHNHCYSYKDGTAGFDKAPASFWGSVWVLLTAAVNLNEHATRLDRGLKRFFLPRGSVVALWLLGAPASVLAANTEVQIGDFFFSPATVTINVNDQVNWTWVGNIRHSTTSSGLWDSGLHTNGYSFSHTFPTAGSFPYICTLHPVSMKGTVTVVGVANVPPTVAITGPKQGATLAAPWSGTVDGTDADSDGTVSKVEIFAGTTVLGSVNNPGATFSVPVSLAAGNYTLTAVATDNLNATTTSSSVSVSVVAPTAITLSSAKRLSDSAFQFSYTADMGSRYVVWRSGDLANWSAISTNTAASTSVTFVDNAATAGVNYYRVMLSPNP